MSDYRFINCPHCDGKIAIEFSLDLIPTPADMTDEQFHKKWLLGLSKKERDFLSFAESSGLLESYKQAFVANPGVEPTKPPQRSFITWLRSSTYKGVPRDVLEFYVSEFPRSKIEFVGANEVLGVLSDGQIKAFLPFRLVKGKKIKTQGGAVVGKVEDTKLTEFWEWVRTRSGYCAGRGWFYKEMVLRARGDFVRPESKRLKSG